jgi:DNA-binding response OmpR family regulator
MTATTTNEKTILIADDDPDLVNALTQRCEHMGFQVLAAEDAMTALSTADFATPDVICLDIEMPNGNGLAACEMIADDERFASTPIIILTGKKDQKTIRRCHELSAYYLPKQGDVWSQLKPLLQELTETDP